MIGCIQGKVLFSDGQELIIITKLGIGYEVYCNHVLQEGSYISLYISHIIKEASQDLYGFNSLREKKLFEVLLQVKGIGAKSAYSLLTCLGEKQIVEAIALENKKILTKAPGVGPRAAAQIILDLNQKIHKISMFSDKYKTEKNILDSKDISSESFSNITKENFTNTESGQVVNSQNIIQDAVMACKELGFKEDRIIPVAQKIAVENSINKAEQLVHLVLREI